MIVFTAATVAILGSNGLDDPARSDLVVAAGAAAVLAGCFAIILVRLFANSLRRLSGAFQRMSTELADRLETITMDRNKLQGVLSGMVEGVIAVDSRERVVLCNDAAARMFGFAEADPLGLPAGDVIHWPRLTSALEECMRDGEAARFRMSMPDSPDESMIEVQATPLRDGRGQPAGAALVIHDISRLRQLEEIRRDLVANVSHELKTPLAAIKGFCETVLEDQEMPVETRQRFLGKIAKQTERLSNLVSDLLTLSRLDEGMGYLTGAEPCDWGRVVRESMRDLLPLAQSKGLEVQVDVPDTPVMVAGETEALRQVVDNLVDNAIKYTQAGGNVRVALRVDLAEAAFEVQDTGIGLSPEHQERVFERFYRVDRARSRELGGTGLGLAIVKNIALNLGGRVSLHSTQGKGSTFLVVLPLAGSAGAR